MGPKKVRSTVGDRIGLLDRHFVGTYGERWVKLREALAAPVRHVAWLSPFVNREINVTNTASIRHQESGCQVLVSLATSAENEKTFPVAVATGDCRLLPYYPLDGASILPALALMPKRGDRVLDACAAPGGKTLLLADQLHRSGGGELISNEKASSRRQRLRRIVDDYIPSSSTGDFRHSVDGRDATDKRQWQGLQLFDKILVDAPCSSERHFIRGAANADWSVSRLKRDAKLQLAILRSMLTCLKPGGTLVYSTCALDPQQNDDVIGAVLNDRKLKHPHKLQVNHPLQNLHFTDSDCILSGINLTTHGAIALPDQASGFGPLYWSVLTSVGYRSQDSNDYEPVIASYSSDSDEKKHTFPPLFSSSSFRKDLDPGSDSRLATEKKEEETLQTEDTDVVRNKICCHHDDDSPPTATAASLNSKKSDDTEEV